MTIGTIDCCVRRWFVSKSRSLSVCVWVQARPGLWSVPLKLFMCHFSFHLIVQCAWLTSHWLVSVTLNIIFSIGMWSQVVLNSSNSNSMDQILFRWTMRQLTNCKIDECACSQSFAPFYSSFIPWFDYLFIIISLWLSQYNPSQKLAKKRSAIFPFINSEAKLLLFTKSQITQNTAINCSLLWATRRSYVYLSLCIWLWPLWSEFRCVRSGLLKSSKQITVHQIHFSHNLFCRSELSA